MDLIKLKQFEGPFDLLLSLIDEKKMDISEIALSEVTEQYLNYLNGLEEIKPEELADFLVVATKLLLIKSKMILPQFIIEEDEQTLEEQLKLYKKFLEASKKVSYMWNSERRAEFRIEPLRRPVEFIPPPNLTLDLIRESMIQLIDRIRPLKALPQTQIDKTISMKEKVEQIHNLLKKNKSIQFNKILNDASNRAEIIISFLALLELVKLKFVGLNQDKNYGKIIIQATK